MMELSGNLVYDDDPGFEMVRKGMTGLADATSRLIDKYHKTTIRETPKNSCTFLLR